MSDLYAGFSAHTIAHSTYLLIFEGCVYLFNRFVDNRILFKERVYSHQSILISCIGFLVSAVGFFWFRNLGR